MPVDALPIPHAEQRRRLGARLGVGDRNVTVVWGAARTRMLRVDRVATRTLFATVKD